jgi:hypothetical protein
MNGMTARIIRSGEFIYATRIAPKNKLWFNIGWLASLLCLRRSVRRSTLPGHPRCFARYEGFRVRRG